MRKYYTSVIFVRTIETKTAQLKSTFSNSPLLKVFSANETEEVQQIIGMSERSAVIFENESDAAMSFYSGSDPTRGFFRKYIVDWDPPEERRFRNYVDRKGTLTIKAIDIGYAIWKIEAYLFGLADVYSKKSFLQSPMLKNPFGQAYFTHFKYVQHDWKIMISTHERESNISGTLGKNWEQLIENVFSDTSKYKDPIEELLEKPYFQIIYPHFIEGEMKKLSLVHMAYNAEFEENHGRFLRFLATI